MAKPQILVLCTGNSARSQIAAAYLRHFAGDAWEVYSAGTEPAAQIHPMARQVLEEAGLDLGDERPKDYRQYLGRLAPRTLVIVCDGAARSCPSAWPGVVERLLWPVEDPAAVDGSAEGRLAAFRRVRDALAERVLSWAEERRPERVGA